MKTKTLHQHIIAIIDRALARTGNNKTRAAKQLCCSVRYIRYAVVRNKELEKYRKNSKNKKRGKK